MSYCSLCILFEKRYMKKAVMTYFEAIVIVVLTIFVQESVLYSLMWITNTTPISDNNISN